MSTGDRDPLEATPSLRGYPVVTPVTVAWGDLDAFGHVNNTVFFRYFETVRIAYFGRIGLTEITSPDGVAPILAETGCRFRRPLHFPDDLLVAAQVDRLGADRFHMAYRIHSRGQDAVVADGFGIVVAYDYTAGRKTRVPDQMRAAILDLEAEVADWS